MEDCIKFSCNVPLSRVRWCVVVRLVPKRPRLVVYHSTPCSTSPPPFLPSSSSSFPFWQVTQVDPVLSLSHQEAAAYNGKGHLSCQVVTRSAWDTLGYRSLRPRAVDTPLGARPLSYASRRDRDTDESYARRWRGRRRRRRRRRKLYS